MSNEFSEEEAAPLPDYEVRQYIPEAPDYSADSKRELRAHYGRVRTFFKLRPQRYRNLQRWLNQARMGTAYDLYLTRSVTYAVVAALLGAISGVLITLGLERFGLLEALDSPVEMPLWLGQFVEANELVLAGAVFTLLGGGLLAATVYELRYYWPRLLVNNRRRNIETTLPQAIVYMYALSYGGMNFIEVVRKVSESEDAYGEVANEFDMIYRDVELFGNDLYTALRNARNITPSESMEEFIDDLLSVLDAGGDTASFLEAESDKYLQRARDEHEEFLTTLETLSEVFVVAFVAAPLFLVVTLVVVSFLGADTTQEVMGFVYLLLPLGMALFIVLVSTLGDPFTQSAVSAEIEGRVDRTWNPDFSWIGSLLVAEGRSLWYRFHSRLRSLLGRDDDPGSRVERLVARVDAYASSRRRQELRSIVYNPLRTLREQPALTLVFTVPLAAVAVLFVVSQGLATPSVDAFVNHPHATTAGLVILPFLITTVPLSVLYEIRERRRRLLSQRFPDVLNIIASANQMGVSLTESLELVSQWSEGVMSQELRRIRNNIQWNHDASRALLVTANRLSVPQLSRTFKLLAEGFESSGDVHRILDIASQDTRNRFKIEKRRREVVSSYVAVVLIGFLVYLGVIVIINISYLEPISEMSASIDREGLQIGLAPEDVQIYRTLFFHSALIQGAGTGLIAGQLANDDLRNGLKYSIILVLISLGVFVLV